MKNGNYSICHRAVRFSFQIVWQSVRHEHTKGTAMVNQEKNLRGVFPERNVKFQKSRASFVHSKEGAVKMYHCAKCNKMFPKKFTYERHVRELHLGIYSHVCQVCGKGFSHLAV